jgi:hypothetical protein
MYLITQEACDKKDGLQSDQGSPSNRIEQSIVTKNSRWEDGRMLVICGRVDETGDGRAAYPWA